MPRDTRVNGLQLNKLIASGSTGTGAKLVIYPIGAENASNPNQGEIDANIFPTGSIGTDIFMFVSGGSGEGKSAFGGDVHISGNLIVDGTTIINDTMNYLFSLVEGVSETSGSLYASGSIKAYGGLSGSLTRLANGEPYALAGENITLTTASNGQITIAGSPGFFTSTVNGVATSTGSIDVAGYGKFSSGISGALNKLSDGSPFLLAGPAIVLSTGSNGAITIEALTGSVGAPGVVNEIAYNDGSNVLTASAGLSFDPNAGILSVNNFVNATGFSGSLTQLSDGATPYITTIGGVSILTSSNGAIQISGSEGISDHDQLSNRGLADAHSQYLLTSSFETISSSFASRVTTNEGDISTNASSITTLSGVVATDINTLEAADVTINNTITTLSGVVASDINDIQGQIEDGLFWQSDSAEIIFTTGSIQASGSAIFHSGLTGALNVLPDGSPSIIGGTAVTVTTGANGQLTISATPGATLAAGGENELQFNKSTALTASSNLWVQDGEKLWVSGTVEASLGFTGSLTKTVAGTPFIDTSNGLSVSTGSNGQVVISGNPMSASIASEINDIQSDIASAGFGLWYSDSNELIENTGSFAVSGSGTVYGALTVQSGITGALNFLVDGAPAFTVDTTLSVSTGSNGQVTFSGSPLSSSLAARIAADEANLTSISSSIATDINTLEAADVTINNTITTLSGVVATDINTLEAADTTINNSITTLSGVVATDINTLEAADVTINNSITTLSGVVAADVNELRTADTTISGQIASDINDLEAAQAGAAAWYEISATEVETTSSVGITGSLTVKSGITGALNVLPDGNDFLAGADGVVTSTGSNGQVTLGFEDKFRFSTYRNYTSTNLFLADSDNRSVIFVENASNVKVDIPSTLSEGFECLIVQKDTGKAEFRASGSLFYPADFTPSSSQENAAVSILVSGSSKDAYLFGDMYLSDAGGVAASAITFTPITNFTSSNVQAAIAEVNVISSSLKSHINTVSSSISTDINYEKTVSDSTGNRTLTNADSGKTIFFGGGASINYIRVPQNLNHGFNVTVFQTGSKQIQVLASASLKYPATFVTRSAEQNSAFVLVSGSAGLFLGGDLELA